MFKKYVIFTGLYFCLSISAHAGAPILGQFKGNGKFTTLVPENGLLKKTESDCSYAFNIFETENEIHYAFAYFKCDRRQWNDHPLKMRKNGQLLFEIHKDGSLGRQVGYISDKGDIVISFDLNKKVTRYERVASGSGCNYRLKLKYFDLRSEFEVVISRTTEGFVTFSRNFRVQFVDLKKSSGLCPGEMTYELLEATSEFIGH